MIIKQKSVRSISKYTKAFQPGQKLRLVTQIDQENKDKAIYVGFSDHPTNGDSILPEAINPVTAFNAEGRYIPRKDLPKESRYITTIEWTWKQWAGRDQTKTVTESKDIYKDCYQQDFLPPPGLEISWVAKDGNNYVVSKEFEIGKTDPEILRHAINLFLSIFGECELRRIDLGSFAPTNIKRLNWELLPPGKHPWDKVAKHTRELVKQRDSRYRNIILQRQEALSHYKPDEVYIGSGGFRTYIAYVFNDKKTVLLESTDYGNATYVFGENWEDFSRLTKAEVLNNNFQKDRLIHSKGWGERVHRTLK